jgi:hypothetical protein
MNGDSSADDQTSINLISLVDGIVGEMEARGWERAGTIAEELYCEIHRELGIDVPSGRFEAILGRLDTSLKRGTLN